MQGDEITALGTAATGLTEILKRSGVPKRFAALTALLVSIALTMVFAWSRDMMAQRYAWDLTSGAIAVGLVALGVYNAATTMARGKF